MTQTTAPRAAPESIRLQLDPHPSRTTLLDGAWWPRSTDVIAELPSLVKALTGLRGEITHVLLNNAEWDQPHPPRAGEGRDAVRLCWYASQPAGLVTVMSEFGRDRFDLMVVPVDATPASAGSTLAAAADGTDRRHAPELLAGIEHAG
ncbi:hypothetical protein FB565_002912 [Actinoplanes lutulentus]|uniref:Uncharacterized protein n=1 Tax=Actinoplanes lutulentus TaxID=1287878 RepID=A0A327Z1H4_9ACTN|nr:DUF5994 family protein [Actinoplanes lutulentus]MBB2943199.1 hypothetical protein [Actinoplanes lutulentus]RAK28265.1 hypothetical protein B0I29_12032 [Actinoplanes lutulentus]